MGNMCTGKRRNNSGQQRSNLTTLQSNNSGQQRSNLTTLQNNISGQQRSNLTTLQSNISGQQRSNLTTLQSNNSGQQRSNLTALQSNISRQPRSNLTTLQNSISGRQRSNLTTIHSNNSEKCYDPQDRTLTFVDGDDEMDFYYIGYKSLRAKMSCGHAVTPMSLTDHCRRLLDEGQCKFVCGQLNCDVEWSFEEVCKMALLTPEEVEEFEEERFSNAAKRELGIRECPGCKSYVVRKDLSDLSVRCSVCTAKRETTYMFCWQCLREWKGPVPRLDHCDNDGCDRELEILKTCPDIVFKEVEGVTGCPCIRACPTCGMLVRHDETECKNIGCPQCKVEFCFVCLKITTECKKIQPYSHYNVCSSGVAPRQTSIPV